MIVVLLAYYGFFNFEFSHWIVSNICAGRWDWKGKQGEVRAWQEEWSYQGIYKWLSKSLVWLRNEFYFYTLLLKGCLLWHLIWVWYSGGPCSVLVRCVSPQLWLHSQDTMWRWGSHRCSRHHAGNWACDLYSVLGTKSSLIIKGRKSLLHIHSSMIFKSALLVSLWLQYEFLENWVWRYRWFDFGNIYVVIEGSNNVFLNTGTRSSWMLSPSTGYRSYAYDWPGICDFSVWWCIFLWRLNSVIGPVIFEILIVCIVNLITSMVMQGEKDDKIIAVCADDPEYRHFKDIKELPPHRLAEIRRFFEDCEAH